MNRPLVLCYHAISPTWSAGLSVTPDAFESQIAHLLARGWGAATFADVVRAGPAKTMAVTFDDAFASVKTYALPILRRLGVPATVFAPTDYISRQAPLAWPGLDQWNGGPDAAELTPMTWDDLSELSELGWEIGSHTRTHPLLTSVLDDDALAAELRESRRECAERIGRPVTTIAYPYGAVNGRVQAGTRQAGYAAAAALGWPSGRADPYRFPRIGVYNKDSWRRFRVKVGPWSHSSYASKLIARRSADADRY
jgi:peptidoglycan/xylan/chitin deacetylase (PgdA/CDA1 family)